jgi:hypothetical protein
MINNFARSLFCDNVIDIILIRQEDQVDIVSEKQLVASPCRENHGSHRKSWRWKFIRGAIVRYIDLFKQILIRLMKKLDNDNILTLEKDN